MGTVPIPTISPLTVARTAEPVLEPPVPISRIENSSRGSGGDADESYSPKEQEPAPDPIPYDVESQITDGDLSPTHHISYFA
jgi:hypothetical protein